MYTRKTRFPVSANNIPVGFYLQGNEDQVWWTYIFVTEANPQGNRKNPQEKKNRQANCFFPVHLFLVVIPCRYTQGNCFCFSLSVFCISLWVCSPSGKFGFPVVPADALFWLIQTALFWLIQTDRELILLSFDVHRFPVTGLKI